jgi:AcrR family transcriptional regulator
MNQPPTRPSGSGQAAETPDTNEEDEESSPITRTAVLASALEIIDRDGVEGLSMRRLGEAVGRDPMVLYRHVPNKAAVLDGVVEMVFERLSVDTTSPDWSAALPISPTTSAI